MTLRFDVAQDFPLEKLYHRNEFPNQFFGSGQFVASSNNASYVPLHPSCQSSSPFILKDVLTLKCFDTVWSLFAPLLRCMLGGIDGNFPLGSLLTLVATGIGRSFPAVKKGRMCFT